jgi:hypothetical protein
MVDVRLLWLRSETVVCSSVLCCAGFGGERAYWGGLRGAEERSAEGWRESCEEEGEESPVWRWFCERQKDS